LFTCEGIETANIPLFGFGEISISLLVISLIPTVLETTTSRESENSPIPQLFTPATFTQASPSNSIFQFTVPVISFPVIIPASIG